MLWGSKKNHENPPEVSHSALKGGVWSDTSFDRRIFRMPKMLHRIFVHKKGLEVTSLVGILLLIVGGVLLMIMIGQKSAETDEKTQELLCRGFNTLSTATEKKILDLKVFGTPRVCNTIHKTGKNTLPSKDYVRLANNDKKKATAYEMRDLMTKCWWMWLDGKEQNMFNKRLLQTGNPGFVCYTFTIKGKEGSINVKELDNYLSEPYYGVDTSDKCGPRGGGKCSSDCSGISEGGVMWEESPSDKCTEPDKTKCCVPKDTRYECVSKGGECKESCELLGEGWSQFDQWSCPNDKVTGPRGRRCCVKIDNKVSYLDYIQGTRGADTGPGALVYKDMGTSKNIEEWEFKSGEEYAIIFFSPGKEGDFETVVWVVTSAIVVGGIVYFTGGLGIGLVPTLIGTGILGGGIITSGSVKDLNYIIITPYDKVKGKFAESTLPKGE